MDLQSFFVIASISLPFSFLMVGLYSSPTLNPGFLSFLSSHCSSLKATQLLLFSLFAIATIWLIYFFTQKKPDHTNLPPGKFGWPIIGETLDWAVPGRADKFIPERMKLYSQHVFKTSFLLEKMAVLCGPSGRKFIFSNEDKFVKVWVPYPLAKLSFPDSEDALQEMKKWRGLFMDFLKPEAIQKYIHIMDLTAKQHLEEEWAGKETLKVKHALTKLTWAISCRLFMGIEDPGNVPLLADKFDSLFAGLLSLPINLPGFGFHRALKAGNLIRSELRKIIQEKEIQLSEKQDQEAPHLLSHLLSVTDDDGKLLSDTEITSIILGIMFASTETTTSTLTSLVYYLADYPDVYEQVLREQKEIAKQKGQNQLLTWEDTQRMKYSRNVVNEVLRIAPPGPGTFREAIHDISFEGFTIPRGWKIFWPVESTHRDPKYFPNPEKFDPSRFEGSGPVPFTFTPFGGGPRMCPGNEFARYLVLTFMHNLVIKFKWKKLYPNEKIAFIPYLIHPNGLPIRIQPRSDHR